MACSAGLFLVFGGMFCVLICIRRLPVPGAQVITGSYLMPKDKGSKKAARGEDEEEEEEEEEEEREERGEDGSVGYEFVKDYKFNIVHYVSVGEASGFFFSLSEVVAWRSSGSESMPSAVPLSSFPAFLLLW